jgi:hypothetical protein
MGTMIFANDLWAKLEVERSVLSGQLPSFESLENFVHHVGDGAERLEAELEDLREAHQDTKNELSLFERREARLYAILLDEIEENTSRALDSETDRKSLAVALMLRLAKECE